MAKELKAPVLDEEHMVFMLKLPVNLDNISAIQAAAVQTVMDLYDRGCEREQFLELAAPCFALYGQTAKLWMLNTIHNSFQKDELTEAAFDDAFVGLADLIRKQTETVVKTVYRLMECPVPGDTVN